MRPLKLTMTAFGPYKYSETIDFTELEQNHLFVISGNTGAGKTTIFDGICFALYGSASGSDRENQTMLRSDFADDATHTSVELEFELHGRYYRILRQLGHKKKGNKTKTGDKYEFYEKVDGKEVPCVDRQIVSEIDSKVEAIIGLTKDQFKQIVMLPQGEFRKLLTSETENKEEILRRIFKTESYKQIGEQLKQRKQSTMQAFHQEKQKVDQYIGSISSNLPKRENALLFQTLEEEHFNVNQVVMGLEEEKKYYLQKIADDQKQYNELYQLHNKQQDQYFQAKTMNERFKELEEKKARYQELQAKTPTVEIKEKELKEAERASSIEMYERQVLQWRKEEEQKSILLKQEEESKKHAIDHLNKAKEYYEEQESKKEKRDEITKKLDRLNEYLPIVKELDTSKKELAEQNEKAKLALVKLEKVKEELEKSLKKHEENKGKISEIERKTFSIHDKQQRLQVLKDEGRALLGYINLLGKLKELETDVHKKEKSFQEMKEVYRKQEEIWLNNQAIVIAGHLHDGEACPVCGSVEHPKKAENNGKVTTRKELDSLKVKLNEKEALFHKANGTLEASRDSLKEKEEELAKLDIEKQDAFSLYDKVVQEGKQLSSEVEELLKLADELIRLRKASEEELNQITTLREQKEKVEKNYQEYKETYQSAKIRYEERVSRIPEEVRDLAILQKEIQETSVYKQQLENAWDKANKELELAREEVTKRSTALQHRLSQLEETKQKKVEAEKAFATQLKEMEFIHIEEYEKAKMPKQDQLKLKEAIQRFKENKTALHSQVIDLEVSLKDKQKLDLTLLEERLTEIKENYESALNQLHLSKEHYQQVEKLIRSILEGYDEVRMLEKKLATITDLHDMIRGQNEKRISFERYLQIEYLERIIEAANMRLKRISNGQFYLIRSDRQESHGKQSGLGLDVYDTYTGQTRDVKTLSGGEKFNASLCLALGMSDVIQSFQGNISINTMFIDEGFGSLDEEALNKAIDTLIELQQTGRMIGVISHVQELKNMFPAVLQVTKTKEGYSQTNFVLK